MTEHQIESLRYRLTANHVRSERERFLATLPPELYARLSTAPFLVPPESTPILPQLYITEDGLGNPTSNIPVGYMYQAFSWPEPLLEATDQFPESYDSQPAFVLPFGERELPLFCVPFGWARTHFRALFRFSPYGLAAITESLQTGLVSSSYCGYLPDAWTDHETVYELASWHPTVNT